MVSTHGVMYLVMLMGKPVPCGTHYSVSQFLTSYDEHVSHYATYRSFSCLECILDGVVCLLNYSTCNTAL